MIVHYVDANNNLVKESIDTYIDIFRNSDTILMSKEPLLLLFGRGESRWLVQNDDYQIYATGETLKEAFQEFDDLLIYNYIKFKSKENNVEEFKEYARLKKMYLETFEAIGVK